MTQPKPVASFEFNEDEFKKQWAIRGAGMGMFYKEMHGAQCYHQWFVKPALSELTQRNQELELALLKYGRHDSDCVALRIDDEFDAVRLCECGFSKALSMDREK